jgi:hypothetical protein
VTVTLLADDAYAVGSPAAATVTIADDDVPVVKVVASDGSASEAGLSTGAFTVSRDAASSVALTVRYSVGGSATGGSDYVKLAGSVVIPVDAVSVLVTVTPLQDSLDEDPETVTVTLLADDAYSVGSPAAATVTIADDDVGLPVVRVVAGDATATEQGPTTGSFTIHRSGSTASALTVEYAIGGTAENGIDYKTIPGSVAIPAGQSSVTVVVSPFDDGRDEPNETVTLTLRARSNYAIGSPSTALVMIIDKDNVAVVVGEKAAGKDLCKKGGWASLGLPFKNQGDCVSWYATGGKNPPAGAADNVAVPAGVAPQVGKDACKQGGWASLGLPFKNQGDCVSWYAKGGKNPSAGG